METMTRWSLQETPAALRPGSLFRTDGGTAAKVWVNALWVRSVSKKPAVTFGSIWAVVPVDGPEPVTLEMFCAAFDPRRFDQEHDGAVSFDGHKLTARGRKPHDPLRTRMISPHRARELAPRLIELHAAVSEAGKEMPAVPAGYAGWLPLTPKG